MSKVIKNADVEVIGNVKVSDVPNVVGDIVTRDNVTGKLQKRTTAETLTDIGAAAAIHIHNFAYEQLSASATWNVAHGLGKFCSVTVVDSAKTVIRGQVDFTDANNVVITFNSATTGFAYFN